MAEFSTTTGLRVVISMLWEAPWADIELPSRCTVRTAAQAAGRAHQLRLTVTMDMFCDVFQAAGKIDLMSAKIDALVDDRKSWPQRLSLDGLTYRDLTYMPARRRRVSHPAGPPTYRRFYTFGVAVG